MLSVNVSIGVVGTLILSIKLTLWKASILDDSNPTKILLSSHSITNSLWTENGLLISSPNNNKNDQYC